MNDETPGLRPIKAFLQPLAESSKGSKLSTTRSTGTEPSQAVSRAKVLAGCYRKDDAADPETYAMAVAAVLSEYPPDIVQRVTDPRSGLPSRSQWLPTVKEVRDACEELDQRRRGHIAREKQIAEQLAARKSASASREHRPTLDELREKYGRDFGRGSESEEAKAERLAREERRKVAQQKANQVFFERECKAHHFPPESPISPSLAALIKQGVA